MVSVVTDSSTVPVVPEVALPIVLAVLAVLEPKPAPPTPEVVAVATVAPSPVGMLSPSTEPVQAHNHSAPTAADNTFVMLLQMGRGEKSDRQSHPIASSKVCRVSSTRRAIRATLPRALL